MIRGGVNSFARRYSIIITVYTSDGHISLYRESEILNVIAFAIILYGFIQFLRSHVVHQCDLILRRYYSPFQDKVLCTSG